jgi:hypothetical protein
MISPLKHQISIFSLLSGLFHAFHCLIYVFSIDSLLLADGLLCLLTHKVRLEGAFITILFVFNIFCSAVHLLRPWLCQLVKLNGLLYSAFAGNLAHIANRLFIIILVIIMIVIYVA